MQPERWRLLPPGDILGISYAEIEQARRFSAPALTVITPLLALYMSVAIWVPSVTRETWGWIALIAAAILALVAWRLKDLIEPLDNVHAFMAGVFLTFGLIGLLDDNALLLALAAEVVVLYFIATRVRFVALSIVAGIVSAAVGVWLATRLVIPLEPGAPILTQSTLTDMAVLV